MKELPPARRQAIIANYPHYPSDVPCKLGHLSGRITATGACLECMRIGASRYRQRTKKEAMDAYGGVCACCDETHLNFLSIDHSHGNGSEHRRETGSTNIYAWLKRHLYPDGFRVLCFNCNYAIGAYGVCSHPDHKNLTKVPYAEIA